jgi:hypothetical protein
MWIKNTAFCFAFICVCLCAASDAQEKKRSGTVVGALKSQKDINNGKNTQIEVLAPGEEKARAYFFNFDPKLNPPIPTVLKAVRAAKVGDVVELEWVDTNHGPAIQSFKLFKKSAEKGK